MKYMWIILALLAAVVAAAVVVLSKAGMKDVNPSLVFAIQSVFILVLSWSVVFIRGNHLEIGKIDSKTWLFISAAGVLTTVSSLLTFQALKIGDAAAVSPVERISLVFAIVFSAIFLKERITWPVVIGAVLMVAGAVIIAVAKKNS